MRHGWPAGFTSMFTIGTDQAVTMHAVSIGQRQGDITVISDGLQVGDKVVTAGQLGLITGKKVAPIAWQPPVPVTERLPSASPSPTSAEIIGHESLPRLSSASR